MSINPFSLTIDYSTSDWTTTSQESAHLTDESTEFDDNTIIRVGADHVSGILLRDISEAVGQRAQIVQGWDREGNERSRSFALSCEELSLISREVLKEWETKPHKMKQFIVSKRNAD